MSNPLPFPSSDGTTSYLGQLARVPLLAFIALHTIVTGGPLLWVASMSLRTTAEIFKSPYGLPSPAHWEKFADAWVKSNYATYFWNSTVTVVTAVILVTGVGAMAAHCLARYHFRGNRLVRFLILSGLVLPPQLLILALFQILLEINLYNTLTGLVLVYVATHVAVTVYILEGFFAQIPQDLFDAARVLVETVDRGADDLIDRHAERRPDLALESPQRS